MYMKRGLSEAEEDDRGSGSDFSGYRGSQSTYAFEGVPRRAAATHRLKPWHFTGIGGTGHDEYYAPGSDFESDSLNGMGEWWNPFSWFGGPPSPGVKSAIPAPVQAPIVTSQQAVTSTPTAQAPQSVPNTAVPSAATFFPDLLAAAATLIAICDEHGAR